MLRGVTERPVIVLPFRAASTVVAQWFKERPFWPKQYLFVTQYELKAPRTGSFNCLGILTTKLEKGRLAEDMKQIVVQLDQGVMGDTVKKAILYPHMTKRNANIIVETKAKVFEGTPKPAEYFYDFLNLEQPISPLDILVKTYKMFHGSGKTSMQALENRLSSKIASSKLHQLSMYTFCDIAAKDFFDEDHANYLKKIADEVRSTADFFIAQLLAKVREKVDERKV